MAGSRVNDVYLCTKNGATLEWKMMAENSPTAPLPRASQSSAYYGGKLYIFGGMDEDNTKFCDLWELDLSSETWKEIQVPAGTP